MKNKLLVGLAFFVFIFNVLDFTTSAQIVEDVNIADIIQRG